MVDISHEFGYHVTMFHHAVEAYKIADILNANDICVATWANWWGFKMEGYDAIEDNVPLLHKAGVCAVIKSDDPDLTQRLNQEAAEAMSAGKRDGIDIPEREAIEWITRNPAKALGILDQTGTLEPGKRADVVIWDKDPFSIYALTQKVYIDGALTYDRHDPRRHPESDFRDRPPRRGDPLMIRARKSTLMLAAAAAVLAVAAPASAETIAIVNAHIFTCGAMGEIQSGTVVVRDGKIQLVSKGNQAPSDARVIDAHGGIVTPGLIASDTALGAVEVGALGNDLTVKGADVGAAFDVSYGLDPDSTLIPVARLGGITGAVVMPEPAGQGFGDADEGIENTAGVPDKGSATAGLFAGQAAVVELGEGRDMLVKARVAMVSPLGELGAKTAGGARGAEFVELKEALEDVRWYAKNRAGYDKGEARALHLSRADLEAMIPVVEGRQPLVLSVDRASDIRQALRLAREEHLKIILDGAAEGWRVADEIAAAHVTVIVYPLEDLPNDFERLGATMENAGRLSAAGVEVMFKAADGSHRVRETRYDAGNAVAHGMKWQAALNAVTINPARAFGVDGQMGSIEAGKDADLVIWSGDPFEPASQPQAVIINGREQPLTSRQIELMHRYETLNQPYPVQYK